MAEKDKTYCHLCGAEEENGGFCTNKSCAEYKRYQKDIKYLYCPKCKDYPDKIYSKEEAWTNREWDGEFYQGYDTEYGDTIEEYCQKCDSVLVEKP